MRGHVRSTALPWAASIAVFITAASIALSQSPSGEFVGPVAPAAGGTTMPAARVAPPAQLATILLEVGKSRVVVPPWPAKRVAVTDPKIADVQVLAPNQVLLQGKAVGSTDLLMWNEREEAVQARVEVGIDLEALRDKLMKLFPGSRLEVARAGDVVTVSGSLALADHAVQLRRLLDNSGLKYVDLTRLAGVQQVQIQVRVAEMSRQSLKALTINTFFTGNDFFGGSTIGPSQSGPIVPIQIGPPQGATAKSGTPFVFNTPVNAGSSVTLFGGFPEVPLEFFIQALTEDHYMRILAEPNLVALSGQEASFLAGGEYPIPVVQGASTAGTSISIEYKEFGVRLKFRPLVMGDGAIQLHVAPEVSQLSSVGAVVLQGFQVPSLITRKAETTLQLKSGQTFGMAGLMNQTVDARSSRVPGLGDVPVLGALFRSVQYERGETELVVLVTASLVEPIDRARMPVPGAAYIEPNDWELYAEGRVEGRPPPAGPCQRAFLKERGLDRLRGPGAWAAHEDAAPRPRPAECCPAPKNALPQTNSQSVLQPPR